MAEAKSLSLTNLDQGLTADEVQRAVQSGQKNAPTKPLTKSIQQIVSGNFLTLFNLINIVLGVLIAYTGSYKNLLFLGIAIVNTAIGTFQEIRSKRQIDKMTILSEGKVKVRRNGEIVELRREELVLGDLLIVARGDQIPLDGIVRTTKGIELDESLITGEPNAISKQTGDQMTSGSFIVSGQAVVQVTAIGEKSYVHQITAAVQTEKPHDNSVLLTIINRIIKILTIVIIPLGVILFISKQMHGSSFNQAILGTSAAMIGMIPEGLVLLTSVALAVSARKLANRNVLVRELPAIENLARVDTLCLDKTGTITSGNLIVDHIIPLGSAHSDTEIKTIMGSFINGIDDHNETAEALKRVLPGKTGQIQTVIPFSSDRKWSGAAVNNQNYVLGAPEFIQTDLPKELATRIMNYSKEGFRVLCFASTSELTPTNLGKVMPLALILITDELRENAKNTFEYFNNQDVALKVVSGDNPVTVSKIAQNAGIKNTDKFVDMSQLGDQPDYGTLVATYTVFGRVKPEQKQQLIAAWQDQGHKVAMTGDGVNDILALRQADCGIAMASGSEAAKSISDFVLIHSNFDAMIAVLNEGRRVINNIEQVASLYLIKTMYSVALSLLFIFLKSGYPFQPIQLTPISTLMVGIPSFVLALEPNYGRITDRFMKQVMEVAVPAAICVVGYISVIFIVGGGVFGLKYAQTSTLSVILTGAVCLTALITVSRPLNRLKVLLLTTMATLFIITVVFFSHLFSLVSLFNLGLAMLYIPLLVTVYPIYFVVQELLGKRVFSKIKWKTIK